MKTWSKKYNNKKSKDGKGQHRQQQQTQRNSPSTRSRRLNPNQNNTNLITPSDTNNNVSSTTNASSKTNSSSIQSDEAELIRMGIHPFTKHLVRTCICMQSDECRKLMWRFAAINDKPMFPCHRLPGFPAKKYTSTGQHVIGHLNNVCNHLCPEVNSDILNGLPKEKWVSLLHLKAPIRGYLDSNQSRNQFK